MTRSRTSIAATKSAATGAKPAGRAERRPSNRGQAAHFTHFDAAGQAHMVDVAGKDVTRRIARAGGRIVMQAATLALIRAGTAKKGDVLGVARMAAIQAAKRTADLIPLCHPLPLTRVAVEWASTRRRRGPHRSDLRNAGAYGRRDGGAHRGRRRPAHHLRHVQVRRPGDAHRGRASSWRNRAANPVTSLPIDRGGRPSYQFHMVPSSRRLTGSALG